MKGSVYGIFGIIGGWPGEWDEYRGLREPCGLCDIVTQTDQKLVTQMY